MTAPGTSPPPSTRSISSMPVLTRGASSARTSLSRRTPTTARPPPRGAFSAAPSTSEFHSPQSAHCPAHFGKLAPQFWQTKCVLARAIEEAFLMLWNQGSMRHNPEQSGRTVVKERIWSKDWFAALVFALLFFVFAFGFFSDGFQGLERYAYDFGVRSRDRAPSDKVAIIAIDD